MTASEPRETDSPELAGLCILVVEDSWQVGIALKDLLRAMGAEVAGPVASAADAERLISGSSVDAAIVDVKLRAGELAYDLIDRLNDRGIRVIVASGYEAVSLASGKAAAILQKPIREELLVDALRPIAAQKTTR